MTDLSIKLKDTWALLIGVGEFADKNLPAIPAVTNNLAKLRELLANTAIVGIPLEQIIVIGDEEVPQDNSDILSQVDKLPPIVETLLVYYVGHGIPYNGIDRSCEKLLYLAHFKTPHDSSCMALPFVDLWNETINRATNLIYILDCCLSGKALSTVTKKVGRNISVLTATLPTENAKALKNEENSSFTKHLIELLEKGFGEVPTLTTTEIRKELGRRLPITGSPKPWGEDFLDSEEPLRIAYNRAFKFEIKKPGPPRKLLPYLVNRLEQVSKLMETIEKHEKKQRPLVCLIHGEDCQMTDKFVECIAKQFLPNWTGNCNNSQESLFFPCDFKNVAELHEKIKFGLSLKLAPTELDDGGVVKKIKELCRSSPVIFETNMTTQNWNEAGGVEIILGFAKFWASLGNLCGQLPQSQLVLVCLRFTYEHEGEPSFFKFFKKFSVNEKIRKTLATLQFPEGVSGVVLPELRNIEKKHVTDWAEYYLKNKYDEKLKQRIRSLFKDHQTVAMEHLAPELKEML
jgi:hypothetical protein